MWLLMGGLMGGRHRRDNRRWPLREAEAVGDFPYYVGRVDSAKQK